MDQGMLGDDYDYWRIRESLPRNDPRHAYYGPLEHRQFTRETVRGNPLMALPLAAATPVYTGLKAAGEFARRHGLPGAGMFPNTRSPASMDEVFAGFHGITEGMLDHLVPSAHAHHEQSETVQRPDGKWINVYGKALPQAGQQLPGTEAYDTVDEAVRAARKRSDETKPGKTPRTGRIPGMPNPYEG